MRWGELKKIIPGEGLVGPYIRERKPLGGVEKIALKGRLLFNKSQEGNLNPLPQIKTYFSPYPRHQCRDIDRHQNKKTHILPADDVILNATSQC